MLIGSLKENLLIFPMKVSNTIYLYEQKHFLSKSIFLALDAEKCWHCQLRHLLSLSASHVRHYFRTQIYKLQQGRKYVRTNMGKITLVFFYSVNIGLTEIQFWGQKHSSYWGEPK